MAREFLRNTVTALLIGGAVGGAFGVWQGQVAWTASIEELKLDTLLATDKLEQLMRNLRLGAEAVAARLDSDDLAGSAVRAWPAIELENLGLRNVLVLDDAGTVVANMREQSPTLGMNFSDRECFQVIAEGQVRDYYISAPIITRPAGLCCTNRVRDSSRESSVVAGMHEQTDTTDLQDQELASLQ